MLMFSGHFDEVSRTVVYRLTSSPLDGQWYEVYSSNIEVVIPVGRPIALHHPDNPCGEVGYKVIPLRPTGNLEWDGNRCAEVWVPEDKLGLWRAEHDWIEVEGDQPSA